MSRLLQFIYSISIYPYQFLYTSLTGGIQLVFLSPLCWSFRSQDLVFRDRFFFLIYLLLHMYTHTYAMSFCATHTCREPLAAEGSLEVNEWRSCRCSLTTCFWECKPLDQYPASERKSTYRRFLRTLSQQGLPDTSRSHQTEGWGPCEDGATERGRTHTTQGCTLSTLRKPSLGQKAPGFHHVWCWPQVECACLLFICRILRYFSFRRECFTI